MSLSAKDGRVFSALIVVLSVFLFSFPGSAARAEPGAPAILEPLEISQHRGADNLEVKWETPSGTETTHLILARDRFFRRIAYENTHVPGTFFLLENLNYGTYFLKVAAVSVSGKKGPFSETRTFIITPPPPKTITGTIP